MKKLFVFCLMAFVLPALGEESASSYKQDYLKEKAWEARIYDDYREAMPFKEPLPLFIQKLLEKFELSEKDVRFYTATKMDHFVEKMGNNVIMLRPNFFLYLNEEQQATEIVNQLARIKAGDKTEIAAYDLPKKYLNNFKIGTSVLGVLGCAGICYKDVIAIYKEHLPALKKGLTKVQEGPLLKAAALIGGYFAANKIADVLYSRAKNKKAEEYEFAALDIIQGKKEWREVKEKQKAWQKKNLSWIGYRWNKLKAAFHLSFDAETAMNRYEAHLAYKQKDKIPKIA